MEGSLEKRAGRSALKRWQRRWFKLVNFKLSYYKFENDLSPRGTWDLRNLKKLVSPPLAPGRTSESSTLLNLHFGHRVHELRAPTVKCKRTWLMVLQVFVDYHECPDRPIPIPDVEFDAVIACFNVLENTGVKKKGIFRIPGENFKCKRIYRDLIFEGSASLQISVEPHVIACVAKQLVRNLPETLLTNQLFDRFIHVEDEEELQVLIHYLPLKYKDILQRLSEVMALVCRNEEHTKMDCKNLAVVVGPNLMRKNGDIEFADTSNLFNLLITQQESIFTEPDEGVIDRYPEILELLQPEEADAKDRSYGDEFSWRRRDSDVSLSSVSTASLSICSMPPTFGTMSQYSLTSFSRRASGGFDEHELDMSRTRIAELEDEIGTLETRNRKQLRSYDSLKKEHEQTRIQLLSLQSGENTDLAKAHEVSFQSERIARVNAETELEKYKAKFREGQQKLAELSARLMLEGPSPLPRMRSSSIQPRQFNSPPMASIRPLSTSVSSRHHQEGYESVSEVDEPVSSRSRVGSMPLIERHASTEMATLAKRLQTQITEMQNRAAKAESTVAAVSEKLSSAMSELAKSEKETKDALQTVEHQQKTITGLNIELESLRARLKHETESKHQIDDSKELRNNETALSEKIIETNEKESNPVS